MQEILTITRKDIHLLILDKTSLILTFALPIILIGLIGNVMSTSFPNVGISSYDYAFSKFMFWGLFGGAASSVASMAVEKNSGTIIRLQVAPIGRVHVLLAKSLACIVFLLFSSVISYLFAKLLFGIKTGSFLTLAVVLISNAIFLAGLTTFLSNFVKTERAAGGLSWGVLQVLACFSGIMFPVSVMPSWMQATSNFNPVTWSVKAMEIALWKEVTFQEILLPIGVPIVAGIILFSISVYIFRWTSDK
jgi:ABC-2 type transport system permease protein